MQASHTQQTLPPPSLHQVVMCSEISFQPKNMNHKTIVLSLAALMLALSTASATVVLYEPFADSNSSLQGNTPGTGFTGTWLGGSGTNPSIIANTSYGSLDTTGNAVSVTSGWTNNQLLIDTSNPAYTNLLADGGDMWFSILFSGNLNGDNTAYSRFAFALGSSNFTSNGDLDSGQAVGFVSANSQRFYAGLWDNTNYGVSNLQGPPSTATSATGYTYTGNQTYLIVGHAQWGSDNLNDNDTVTLYLPDTSLNLGSAIVSSTGITDQHAFDRLMTHNGNGITNSFDEIRFGATLADVMPVPEPSTALLGVVGSIGLLLPRRRTR